MFTSLLAELFLIWHAMLAGFGSSRAYILESSLVNLTLFASLFASPVFLDLLFDSLSRMLSLARRTALMLPLLLCKVLLSWASAVHELVCLLFRHPPRHIVDLGDKNIAQWLIICFLLLLLVFLLLFVGILALLLFLFGLILLLLLFFPLVLRRKHIETREKGCSRGLSSKKHLILLQDVSC